MRADFRPASWEYLLLIAAIFVPWLLALVLPPLFFPSIFAFWIVIVIGAMAAWLFPGGRRRRVPEREPPPGGPRMLHDEEQPPVVREVMEVRVALEEDGIQMFRGKLKAPADAVYGRLKAAFGGGMVPMIQEDEQLGTRLLLLPKPVEEQTLEKPGRPWVNWLLFFLTILTTTWAGAANEGVDLLAHPGRFAAGLPYSIGLLLILGVHELGHYFTTRHHRMNVTPPYFIPVPFALGTFGAFIKMKSPPETRTALFDVAVAGPLAGVAVAIPAFLIGLRDSPLFAGGLHPGGFGGIWLGGTRVSSSMLLALLSRLHYGEAAGYDTVLRLSPLAFAGWLGFFVTALNLLPVGQLDGGHIARAIFGGRGGATISNIALWSLFLLAVFVWPELMFWVLIVFFLAGRGVPPLNDITPVSPGRKLLGYFAFLLLLLILAPVPRSLWNAAGWP